MLKRFACHSIFPGCGEVFTGVGDQGVLDQVLAHAAADHGVDAPALPFIELVMTHTHPFTPGRHLRSIGPDAGASVPDAPRPVLRGNVYPLRQRDRRGGFGRAHEAYRHECVFYSGTGEFLDAMVPFVRDGLARQEPVMVAVAEPRLQALRAALGENAENVIFADMAELGHNPALIIPAWRDFTDRHSGMGRPVRGIGEPIWATRRPEEIREAQLHEALLNVAVPPDTPLWLLCAYDTTDLDQEVLDEAARSHPVLVESDNYRGSTEYGGTVHVEEIFGGRLPPPQAATSIRTLDPIHHVQQTLDAATRAGLQVGRAARLAVAIDELARAVDQDTGHVVIRLWYDQTAMIGEIVDPGTVHDPMIGRGPGRGRLTPRERAICLAHELCDLVQVRSGTTGTTTRIHTWP